MKGTFSLPAVLSLAAISLAAIAWGSASFAAPPAIPDERAQVLIDALKKVLSSKEYRDICSKQHKCLSGFVLGEDARKYAAQYHEDMSKLMKELGLAK
jgi:tripartite-type tricarboxylate transporter receptor subunit TctC